MNADRHGLSGDGGHLADMMRAEAELLSSHDTHQVIAGRLGISLDMVQIWCKHLVQRSRLGRCTHVQHADGKSEQRTSDWFGQQNQSHHQGPEYSPTQQQPTRQPHGKQPRQPSFTPYSQEPQPYLPPQYQQPTYQQPLAVYYGQQAYPLAAAQPVHWAQRHVAGKQYGLRGAESFWYILGCIGFGIAYFAKLPGKKAACEVFSELQLDGLGPSDANSLRGAETWTPTGFVDTIRSGTMVYEERTGSGTGSQEVHPGI